MTRSNGIYMKRTNASFAYRLAAHCKLEGDCIVYLGVPQNKGYPVLTANHKHYLAHRLAYEVFVGPIPKGMWVLHKCDNRACIKPDHLWLGTPKDNIDDMMRKGRSRPYFAEQNPRAKLTYMQAQEIRRLHHKSISQAELSKMYDVSDSTI